MAKKTKPEVSILIPSYKTLPYLESCLEHIKDNTNLSYEVIILALGEKDLDDGTYTWAKKNKYKVIKKEAPFYFSQSCNLLAEKASAKKLLFLNPDTEPQKNFLEEMVKEMDESDAVIVGAKLLYPLNTKEAGSINHAGMEWGGILPTPEKPPSHTGLFQEDSLAYSQAYDVQGITGACMLIDAEFFNQIGGFDENYKNGYEDVDICVRTTLMGKKIRYTGKAEVIHYVSGSMGTDGKSRTSTEFMIHNAELLFTKNFEGQKIAKAATFAKDTVGKPTSTENVSPVRPYKKISVDSNDPGYINRVLIATPTMGTIRMEWALSRYGQTVPVNWSQVQMVQWYHSYSPIRYSVANAQNLIVKEVLDKDFEWLLLLEDDVILPPDGFVRFNNWMRDERAPIVSGVYFTKSSNPEPLVFRGRGNSVYTQWKAGDVVMCDGVPTGCLLVHRRILKSMWDESPDYIVNGLKTRRVFDTPRKVWWDPTTGQFNTLSGTSDLDWCTRVMEEKHFEKAGWHAYQKKKYPFVLDTNIYCKHIDRETGKQYP